MFTFVSLCYSQIDYITRSLFKSAPNPFEVGNHITHCSDHEEDALEEAKKTWELGNQLGLFAEHENEILAELANRRKMDKGGIKQSRKKKYKGNVNEVIGVSLDALGWFLGVLVCGVFFLEVWTMFFLVFLFPMAGCLVIYCISL